MKKRTVMLALAAALLLTGCGGQNREIISSAPADRSEGADSVETIAAQETSQLPEQLADEIVAVYLGVEDYGAEAVNKETQEDFRYRFFADGTERIYSVANGETTETGYTYEI